VTKLKEKRTSPNAWRDRLTGRGGTGPVLLVKSALIFVFIASTNGLPRRAALAKKPISPDTTTLVATVAAVAAENRKGVRAAMRIVAKLKIKRARPT
jgi:hypothetical protein